MHLIYLDESGNSGNNLNDSQQPWFVLCAMIVEESRWQSLERSLQEAITQHFPIEPDSGGEIHGSDLRTGRGRFSGMSVTARIEFRDAWMKAAAVHGVRLIYRGIDKKRYQKWLAATFGSGILINPHIVAFALLSRVIDGYLKSLSGAPLGMFISDDNKEIVADVEKAIRELRFVEGSLRLGQIVEKGFFINSAHSLPVQLCDLFALSLRKREERNAGMPARSIDDSGIQLAESLIFRGDEAFSDVIAWLTQQHAGEKK
jgi:hypothetical protein